MKTIAVLLFCVLGGVGLLMFVSTEYRLAVIAALVVLAIIDAFADQPQKRRLVQFARKIPERIVLPPLSFALWLFECAGDVSPVPKLAVLKGRSRAELKQGWVDSWMTAPARYFRSLGGK